MTAETALSRMDILKMKNPIRAQPSGTLNFSRIDTLKHNTALLAQYLITDTTTPVYNKEIDKRVNYITEMWGYPDRNKFEGVLHLFKENGDSIYWFCRFTDPLMRTAQRYHEGNYSLLQYDCITMLQSAKSSAQLFLAMDYTEHVQWVNTQLWQPFLLQGRVRSYFFDLYQGLDDEDPVSVYFQSACMIIMLFIDQKWQEIVDLVDDII